MDGLTIRRVRDLEAHKALVTDAAYSPDGEHALSCDQSGKVVYWEVAGGTKLWELDEPEAKLSRLAFFKSGKFAVVAGQPGKLLLLDLEQGRIARRYGEALTLEHLSVAVADSGRFLATGGSDASARLFDVETGEMKRLAGHDWPVQDVLFVGNDDFVMTADPQTIRLWKLETGEEVRRLIDTAAAPQGDVFWMSRMAFSADGSFVAAGSGNDVVLFDLATREIVQRFKGHDQEILGVRIAPDNRTVLTSSRDHTTRLWDVETGAELSQSFAADLGFASAIAVSPHENQFLMAEAQFDVFGGTIHPRLSLWAIDR